MDMELVIKLPEKIIKDAKDSPNYYPVYLFETIWKAIVNGTILPEGHGRLGDLDALREDVSSWGMNDYEPSDFIDAIDGTDTIIEADKAESEDEK